MAGPLASRAWRGRNGWAAGLHVLEQGPGSLQHRPLAGDTQPLLVPLDPPLWGVCPRNEVASQSRCFMEAVQRPRL